jgi:hypothetical protein
MEEVKQMWTCEKHVTKAIELLDVPHIRKAPDGVNCSFCNGQANLNVYYSHKPCKFKNKNKALLQTS